MRILEWNKFLEEGIPELITADKNFRASCSAITVGVFDGIHRGHRALIDRIVQRRNELPVIITFRLNKKKSKVTYQGDISSPEQKLELFENLGVAVTVIADLTESFRHMHGKEFLHLLREQGKMGFLAVGSNFRCGYNQDTDAAIIQELNAEMKIPAEIVDVLLEDGTPISSSRIRESIALGKMKEAELMLGRPYILDVRNLENSWEPNAGGESEYGIAVPGRVLPPPGSYNVRLLEESGICRQAVIHIENRFLRIRCKGKCQFIEFSA